MNTQSLLNLYDLLYENVLGGETLYHATQNRGDLDSDFLRKEEANGGWLGDGFYFTNDIEMAKEYSDTILECSFRLNDTLVLTDEKYWSRPLKLTYHFGVWYNDKLTEKLRYNGYDSVLLEFKGWQDYLDRFMVLSVLDRSKIRIIGNV